VSKYFPVLKPKPSVSSSYKIPSAFPAGATEGSLCENMNSLAKTPMHPEGKGKTEGCV
jgi:hypothetical protein